MSPSLLFFLLFPFFLPFINFVIPSFHTLLTSFFFFVFIFLVLSLPFFCLHSSLFLLSPSWLLVSLLPARPSPFPLFSYFFILILLFSVSFPFSLFPLLSIPPPPHSTFPLLSTSPPSLSPPLHSPSTLLLTPSLFSSVSSSPPSPTYTPL